MYIKSSHFFLYLTYLHVEKDPALSSFHDNNYKKTANKNLHEIRTKTPLANLYRPIRRGIGGEGLGVRYWSVDCGVFVHKDGYR